MQQFSVKYNRLHREPEDAGDVIPGHGGVLST
jgi:hypothetical protein